MTQSSSFLLFSVFCPWSSVRPATCANLFFFFQKRFILLAVGDVWRKRIPPDSLEELKSAVDSALMANGVQRRASTNSKRQDSIKQDGPGPKVSIDAQWRTDVYTSSVDTGESPVGDDASDVDESRSPNETSPSLLSQSGLIRRQGPIERALEERRGMELLEIRGEPDFIEWLKKTCEDPSPGALLVEGVGGYQEMKKMRIDLDPATKEVVRPAMVEVVYDQEHRDDSLDKLGVTVWRYDRDKLKCYPYELVESDGTPSPMIWIPVREAGVVPAGGAPRRHGYIPALVLRPPTKKSSIAGIDWCLAQGWAYSAFAFRAHIEGQSHGARWPHPGCTDEHHVCGTSKMPITCKLDEVNARRLLLNSSPRRVSSLNFLQIPATPDRLSPSSAGQSMLVQPSFSADFEFRKGKLLGQGSFASVYLATRTAGEAVDNCAAKQLRSNDGRTAAGKGNFGETKLKEEEDNWAREFEIMKMKSNPYIVKYYHFERRSPTTLYLEYCKQTLAEFVKDKRQLQSPEIARFTSQLCQGLEYLHGCGICHGDLKCTNIMLDISGEHSKIADFGMLQMIGESVKAHGQYHGGTPEFMPPRVVAVPNTMPRVVEASTDIWSLGCIVLEMATGRTPWYPWNRTTLLFDMGLGNGSNPIISRRPAAREHKTKPVERNRGGLDGATPCDLNSEFCTKIASVQCLDLDCLRDCHRAGARIDHCFLCNDTALRAAIVCKSCGKPGLCNCKGGKGKTKATTTPADCVRSAIRDALSG